MLTQMNYEAITPDGLKVRSRAGKEMLIRADTIIFASGQVPNRSLYEQLKPMVENCHLVGAARQASESNAQTAIWEASELARRI